MAETVITRHISHFKNCSFYMATGIHNTKKEMENNSKVTHHQQNKHWAKCEINNGAGKTVPKTVN